MLHKNITVGDVHYLQQWEPANSAARTALVVTSADVGKVARQLDTNVWYILTDDSPMTWQALGSGNGTVTSVTSANADATVATTTTTPVITIVQAPALRSATTTVNVSSATAPTNGQVLTATSGTAATWQTPAAGGSGITLGTPQNTTSGTSIDFTSLPAGLKYIAVMFSGVSTNGTSMPLIRVGTGGSPATSGYTGGIQNSSTGTTTSDGYHFFSGAASAASFVASGTLILTLMNSTTNTWLCIGNTVEHSGSAAVYSQAVVVSLSGVLNIIRLTTAGGTDTFDAGSINIQYQS